jgi:ABC-type amino acid transport substrate-binding protein
MNKYGNIVIGIVAVVALIVSFSAKNKNHSQSVSDLVIQKGEIRVGYIIYPPSLIKDEKTGTLSGFSYDIVEAAAKNLGLKTNWVEEVGWGSAIEGLKMKRYDILGTQIWPNSARAREAAFSIAPFYSGLYPYVKTGDTRFSNNLSKLNSDNYIISVLDGEMSSFIAKQDYPKAKVNSLPQLSSYAEVFLNVTSGKADIAFAEPSSAGDFLKSNPGTIVRASEKPVRMLGLDFAFARGENSMVSMWDTALTELIGDGTISRILEKYDVSNDYVLNK